MISTINKEIIRKNGYIVYILINYTADKHTQTSLL